MTHFSPLLWLCSLGAVLLNTCTALDPTGAYSDYLDALDADTPAIAAFFTAAEDGVYPWTLPALDDAETPADPDDALPAPDENTDAASPDADAVDDTPAAPTITVTTVDETYFDDALFLGDSHTDGFHDYAGLRNATYYTKNGITVKGATEKAFIELDGEKLTLAEALDRQQFGKIYIMLGINELGGGTAESWAEEYKTLLALVREKQPDALIYTQAIFHTTAKKSAETFFKNSVIDERNAALAQLADNETIFYLDVNPVFDDDTGALRSDYSGDGVHVRAPYYVLWRDFLFANGVIRTVA